MVGKIVGLDGKDYPITTDRIPANTKLVEMLEKTLAAAKLGDLQEVVLIGYLSDGDYAIGMEIHEDTAYDPSMVGYIHEAAIEYRERSLYSEFEEDDD